MQLLLFISNITRTPRLQKATSKLTSCLSTKSMKISAEFLSISWKLPTWMPGHWSAFASFSSSFRTSGFVLVPHAYISSFFTTLCKLLGRYAPWNIPQYATNADVCTKTQNTATSWSLSPNLIPTKPWSIAAAMQSIFIACKNQQFTLLKNWT